MEERIWVSGGPGTACSRPEFSFHLCALPALFASRPAWVPTPAKWRWRFRLLPRLLRPGGGISCRVLFLCEVGPKRAVAFHKNSLRVLPMQYLTPTTMTNTMCTRENAIYSHLYLCYLILNNHHPRKYWLLQQNIVRRGHFTKYLTK